METNVLDERLRFMRDFESGQWSMTELCERYGVTRPTGYKWLARHRAGGRAGLADRSHAPQECPHRTSDATEALIVEARQEYGWGAKKLLQVLRTRHPTRAWPARSTLNEILERHKLLRKNRRRRRGRTRARPRCRPTIRIRCGPPTSKGSSRPAMARTVIP